MSRTAQIDRTTKETSIALTVDLDDPTEREIASTVPFFDHLLHAMSFHGGFGLAVAAGGDTEVDPHHLVEDVGIVLGSAFSQLSDGVVRFGAAVIPMDEALSEVVIDVCGRPTLVYSAEYPQPTVGTFDLALLREFLLGFVGNARVALHAMIRHGENAHHMAESLFKALGRALGSAYAESGGGVRSTKGLL